MWEFQKTRAQFWQKLTDMDRSTGRKQVVGAAVLPQAESERGPFYWWRKRLRNNESARFTLVETRRFGDSEPSAPGLAAGVWCWSTTNGRGWRGRERDRAAGGAGGGAVLMHLPASVRVYLCLTPCDMRRNFDGLHALASNHLALDALAGHLFVFASRWRDRARRDRNRTAESDDSPRCLEDPPEGRNFFASIQIVSHSCDEPKHGLEATKTGNPRKVRSRPQKVLCSFSVPHEQSCAGLLS